MNIYVDLKLIVVIKVTIILNQCIQKSGQISSIILFSSNFYPVGNSIILFYLLIYLKNSNTNTDYLCF